MISPFKAALGEQYKAIEHRLQQAIHLRFGLPADLPASVEKLIKKADKASAYFEAVQFAGFDIPEALKLFGSPNGLRPVDISAMTSDQAERDYVARFEHIIAQMDRSQAHG